MPPAWRFTALSAAWRRRCATTDDRGLTAAMEALVDRAPIDWPALRTSLHAREDRALVDALHAIDRIRGAARAHGAPPRSTAVRALIAIGTLQTISTLLLAAPHALAVGTRTTMQLVIALTFAAAAALSGFGSAGDGRRLFLLGFLLCCAGSFARASLGAVPGGPPAWLRFVWIDGFAPACLWQFALDFPRVDRFARFDRMARSVAALVWMLAVAAAAVNVAVAAALVPEVSARAFLPNHASNLFWRAHTIATILAVAAIFIRARRAPSPERRKVARLAAALAAGTGPLLVLGVARTASPALDGWLVAGGSPRFWIDAIVIGALVATPLLVSAAIVADRPFDRQQRLPHAGRLARRGLRRLAMWSAARHRRELATALTAMRAARGNRDICRIVSCAIAAGLQVTTARVLVRERERFVDGLGSASPAPDGAAFVAMLRASSAPLLLDPAGALGGVLPAREQRWLEAESIQLAVAITSRHRALAAIVVAGTSDAAPAFTRRDLWFAEAVASAASAAWTEDAEAEPGSVDGEGAQQVAFECPRCGLVSGHAPVACGCTEAPVLAALPARLGALAVLRKLGAGGMGVVYLGRDMRLDRDVALKTLPAAAPDAIARLQAEARAMASLTHDTLATIYGLEVWRDVPVLVCEYFPAGSLADRLRSGPLEPAIVLRLGVALARALDAMHARGLLHGDIKPANVGLTSGGDPKLLDFGLSRLVSTDPDGGPRRTLAGTLAYLSPEALRGEPLQGEALDLWSLAVVLLESLVGRNPFVRGTRAGTRRAILEIDRAALIEPARAVHAGLGAWLDRALGPEPERFASARAMLAALERLSAATPPADHRE